jgi:hypothetical protein
MVRIATCCRALGIVVLVVYVLIMVGMLVAMQMTGQGLNFPSMKLIAFHFVRDTRGPDGIR